MVWTLALVSDTTPLLLAWPLHAANPRTRDCRLAGTPSELRPGAEEGAQKRGLCAFNERVPASCHKAKAIKNGSLKKKKNATVHIFLSEVKALLILTLLGNGQ